MPLPSVPVPDELGSPRDSEETGASGADSFAHDIAVWSGGGCVANPKRELQRQPRRPFDQAKIARERASSEQQGKEDN